MTGPLVDDSMLRLLETEIQNMLEAARKKDQHGLLVHDARFHEIIVEGAGNTVLLDCWSGLRIEAYTLVSMIKSHLDLIAIANAHLPILDALRQRDGSLAGRSCASTSSTSKRHCLEMNPMSDTPLVLDFDDERCRDVELAGGKGASLASMTANGLPVPPGFVITSPAFAEVVDGPELLKHIKAQDLEAARRVVAATEPPRALIKKHFDKLPQGATVAVRSSACAEDSNDASYAGQQETYLFVETFDEVMEKVVECWLSFFSERAMFYREHKGDLDDIQMAVVVQQMVDATKAGVMFTVDPVNHRKDRVVVEAALGIGENVVSRRGHAGLLHARPQGGAQEGAHGRRAGPLRVRARRPGRDGPAPRGAERQRRRTSSGPTTTPGCSCSSPGPSPRCSCDRAHPPYRSHQRTRGGDRHDVAHADERRRVLRLRAEQPRGAPRRRRHAPAASSSARGWSRPTPGSRS